MKIYTFCFIKRPLFGLSNYFYFPFLTLFTPHFIIFNTLMFENCGSLLIFRYKTCAKNATNWAIVFLFYFWRGLGVFEYVGTCVYSLCYVMFKFKGLMDWKIHILEYIDGGRGEDRRTLIPFRYIITHKQTHVHMYDSS